MKPVHTDLLSSSRGIRGRDVLRRELEVTFPTINRWENGRAKPSPLALKQVEDLLRDMGERGRDLLEPFFGEEA